MKMHRSLVAVAVVFGLSFNVADGAPPSQAPSPIALVNAELNGVPISRAEAEELIKAVTKAVKKHPEMASEILSEVLTVNRNDMVTIVAQLTAAVIRALGPNPTAEEVAPLVEIAVRRYPVAVLQIVELAVKVTPDRVAPAIVAAATASVPNITEELAYEINQVVYTAKPGISELAMGKETLPPVGEAFLPGNPSEVPVEEYPRLLAEPSNEPPDDSKSCTLSISRTQEVSQLD
jgi:hypothetical protein